MQTERFLHEEITMFTIASQRLLSIIKSSDLFACSWVCSQSTAGILLSSPFFASLKGSLKTIQLSCRWSFYSVWSILSQNIEWYHCFGKNKNMSNAYVHICCCWISISSSLTPVDKKSFAKAHSSGFFCCLEIPEQVLHILLNGRFWVVLISIFISAF